MLSGAVVDRRRRFDRHRRSRTSWRSAERPSRSSTGTSRRGQPRGPAPACLRRIRKSFADTALLALCRGVAGGLSGVRRRTARSHRSSTRILRHDGTLHVAFDDRRAARASTGSRGVYARNGGDVSGARPRADARARSRRLGVPFCGALFIANEAQSTTAGWAARSSRDARRWACASSGPPSSRWKPTRGACAALRTAHGFVPAGTVVNAAGAWAGAIDGRARRQRASRCFPVAGEMLALAVPHAFARALDLVTGTPIWCRATTAACCRRDRRRPRLRQPGHGRRACARCWTPRCAPRRRWASSRWSKRGPGLRPAIARRAAVSRARRRSKATSSPPATTATAFCSRRSPRGRSPISCAAAERIVRWTPFAVTRAAPESRRRHARSSSIMNVNVNGANAS